jgi:hypothetical protein
MSGRAKRVLLTTVVVAALLLLVQVLTYMFLAEAAMPWTMAGSAGDTSSWFVCVSDESWEALSPVHRAELDKVLGRRFETVYHGESEIPEEKWYHDMSDAKRRTGLKKGVIIGWKVSGRGPLWFTTEYRYWMGNVGAGSKVETFVWFVGTWLRVWTTHGPVA